VLAQRTGALIIAGYATRTAAGRFRIVMEPPIDPAGFATTAELHQAIAAAAERHIRAHLDQWCIFRPLWPDAAAESVAEPSGARRTA